MKQQQRICKMIAWRGQGTFRSNLLFLVSNIFYNMIQKGNIPEKIQTHPETRGWFMGKFFPQNDFFHSKNIELKFHAYKK